MSPLPLKWLKTTLQTSPPLIFENKHLLQVLYGIDTSATTRMIYHNKQALLCESIVTSRKKVKFPIYITKL